MRQGLTRHAYGIKSYKDWKKLEGVNWSKVDKPTVEHQGLKNHIDELYKGGSVGNGSTQDAVRFERATGLDVKGSSHSQKAGDRLRGIEKLMNTEKLSDSDRQAAQRVADDLRDALSSGT